MRCAVLRHRGSWTDRFIDRDHWQRASTGSNDSAQHFGSDTAIFATLFALLPFQAFAELCEKCNSL